MEKFNTGEFSLNFSQNAVHPKAEDSWALDWIFVVDTLNFCFWSLENEVGWTVEETTGYFALCKAINRAMREGFDILNPKFYATITEDQLLEILRSDNNVQIPLFNERLKCLHEVGTVLVEKFESSFRNCVKQADHSAVKLLDLIVFNFDCFKDEAIYEAINVAIYKRAQILVGDIWACYKNQGLGYFEDIDEITMFADYRVPQSLLVYQVLEYSAELLTKLKTNHIFNNGDPMEVEIRGCSIHSVELLKAYIRNKIHDPKNINSIIIDHFLWDFRRQNANKILKEVLPFHKTLSVYY